MVVEGDGHPVLQSGGADGVFQRIHQLAVVLEPLLQGGGILDLAFFMQAQAQRAHQLGVQLVSDGIFHRASTSSLVMMPETSANSMTRLARMTTGLSTILPLRLMTPLPRASASLMAATIFLAFSISFWVGLNTE